MKIKWYKHIPASILFAAIIYLSLSGLACSTEKSTSYVDNNSDIIYQSMRVLESFLDAKAAGRFEDCLSFLSIDFSKRFVKTYKTNFVDNSRNDEGYYNNYQIHEAKVEKATEVIFTVLAVVEDPGVRSKITEYYYMILEDDKWRINEIKYADDYEIIEILKDGKWQRVRQ